MWIRVLTNADIVAGDVLSFDEVSNRWIKATNISSPVGVARNDASLKIDSTTDYVVEIVMQGQVLAKSSRAIQAQGGRMNVENGAVYVDDAADHCGIIAPNPLDYAARIAGDLVTVLIK